MTAIQQKKNVSSVPLTFLQMAWLYSRGGRDGTDVFKKDGELCIFMRDCRKDKEIVYGDGLKSLPIGYFVRYYISKMRFKRYTFREVKRLAMNYYNIK